MTIPTSGAITGTQINAELAHSVGAKVSLNDRMVRLLHPTAAKRLPGVAYSLSELRGRAGHAATLSIIAQGTSGIGASGSDGTNPNPLMLLGGSDQMGAIGTYENSYTLVSPGGAFYTEGRLQIIGIFTVGGLHLATLDTATATRDTSGEVGLPTFKWPLSSGVFDFRPYSGQQLRVVAVNNG